MQRFVDALKNNGRIAIGAVTTSPDCRVGKG